MRFFSLVNTYLAFLACVASSAAARAGNSTYYNPVLPGWHSDPSCTQVDGTFFCVTSTFISFPGLPIYASKDLINWKVISHAWNRESQLPGISWNTTGQQQGMYAASAGLVSGGNGSFVGSLVGAYATCNGAGVGAECPGGGEAYFTRWRYSGASQYVSETEVV